MDLSDRVTLIRRVMLLVLRERERSAEARYQILSILTGTGKFNPQKADAALEEVTAERDGYRTVQHQIRSGRASGLRELDDLFSRIYNELTLPIEQYEETYVAFFNKPLPE